MVYRSTAGRALFESIDVKGGEEWRVELECGDSNVPGRSRLSFAGSQARRDLYRIYMHV